MSEQGQKSLKRYKAQNLVKRVSVNRLTQYTKFQQRYRDDPAAFVQDCFKWGEGENPAAYQNEPLIGWQDWVRLALRGPRGLGKTALAAWLTHYWALVYDGEDWKVAQTASAWRQLEKVLWPEIHKWARRLKWDIIGREPYNPRTELMKQSLRLNTGEAFPIASDNPAATEGVHADHLLYIFDEAKIIQPAFWDSVEGALEGRDQPYKFLAISTPGDMSTRFFAIHARRPGYEDWQVRHITIEEVVAAGMRTWEWVEQRKKQWGADSQLFYNHVLGEFKEADEDAIIPLAWVEMACVRWDAWQDQISNGGVKGQLTSVGVDIGLGGEGGDATPTAFVYDDYNVDKLRVHSRGGVHNATMETAGRIKGIVDNYGCDVYVDVIGIGAGVVARLHEQGQAYTKLVHPFNVAQKPPRHKRKDKTGEMIYANKRAAMWWGAREMLDPASGHDVALPRDDLLIGELTTPRIKRIGSDARLYVESKKDIRKRVGRSTDRADAVLQALTGPTLARHSRAQVYVIGKGYI